MEDAKIQQRNYMIICNYLAEVLVDEIQALEEITNIAEVARDQTSKTMFGYVLRRVETIKNLFIELFNKIDASIFNNEADELFTTLSETVKTRLYQAVATLKEIRSKYDSIQWKRE